MKLKTNQRLLTTLLAVALVITSMCMNTLEVHAEEGGGFTEKQAEDAQQIANICIENWEEYGCLPSVCIAQAWQESNLGKESNGYNWWGICSGGVYYDSLEEGVFGYMRVINNGYYEGAPFEKDPMTQIRKILDGGYCSPEGDYYYNIGWIIDHFDLTKYDDQLFSYLEEKELRLAAIEQNKIEEQLEREPFEHPLEQEETVDVSTEEVLEEPVYILDFLSVLTQGKLEKEELYNSTPFDEWFNLFTKPTYQYICLTSLFLLTKTKEPLSVQC